MHQHYSSALCLECSLNGNIKHYRNKCKFRFNIYDYKNEFDLKLLKEHGWYNRNNNKNGVSRDHLYSVKEGFINKVDFKLLSHPANCKLILQKDNRKKSHRSDIILEQLKNRIYIWNIKHQTSNLNLM